MEVIDLTSDTTPPKNKNNAEKEERRQTRGERKKERRRVREEAERQREVDMKREARERQRERDPRQRAKGSDERGRGRDGKRPRDSSRERDPDRKRRKKDRERDEDVPIPDEQLFFVDGPAPLPPAARYVATPATQEPAGLILPPHVSVFGETPADIPAAAQDSDSDDDYIEYLDYDNRKDFVRYYEEEKRTRVVCKRCGAEDEHSTFACPVLICMSCGARDDHPTGRCDVGKTCYQCGMKGHINSNCPNRNSNIYRARDGCERCHSSYHQTSECPSLWRIYVYVQAGDQERILKARKEKKDLRLGQGGEGYIADDEWCYNCGGAGHWGDDCREFYHPEPLVEPTAFSHHVLSTGPFTPLKTRSGNRAPREWEREIALPGGVENVGRRAKKKEMEKLARRAQQDEADDPGDDWFQNAQNAKNRRRERPSQHRPPANLPTRPRNMPPPDEPFQFGAAAASSSKVSLAERLSDPVPERSKRRDHHSDSRDRTSDDSRRRHDRERDRDRHRGDERGPRYKGGYSR